VTYRIKKSDSGEIQSVVGTKYIPSCIIFSSFLLFEEGFLFFFGVGVLYYIIGVIKPPLFMMSFMYLFFLYDRAESFGIWEGKPLITLIT